MDAVRSFDGREKMSGHKKRGRGPTLGEKAAVSVKLEEEEICVRDSFSDLSSDIKLVKQGYFDDDAFVFLGHCFSEKLTHCIE